jgi:signal transduction histidine kinase
LVREVFEFFEPFAEDREVILALATASVVAPIHGDRDLLFEALSNLIENAVKFTPEGGRVRVELVASGMGPVVSVADSGPGIPAGERKRVFRRFYRAERARLTPGHGPGLGLVAAITQLHGFEIEVGTSIEGGARFTIVCHDAGTPRAKEASPRLPAASESMRRSTIERWELTERCLLE